MLGITWVPKALPITLPVPARVSHATPYLVKACHHHVCCTDTTTVACQQASVFGYPFYRAQCKYLTKCIQSTLNDAKSKYKPFDRNEVTRKRAHRLRLNLYLAVTHGNLHCNQCSSNDASWPHPETVLTRAQPLRKCTIQYTNCAQPPAQLVQAATAP